MGRTRAVGGRSASRAATDGASLRLEFFGGPRLLRGREPVELSPQSMAFLCVVGARGTAGVSRAELIRILWGMEPTGNSRRWLAQTFYAVRGELGDEPFAGLRSDTVRLEEGRLRTDLDEIRDALRRRSPGEVVSMLGQGFLEDLPLDRKAFEEWCRAEGRYFRQEIRKDALRVLEEAEDRADWTRAADAAELLLALDPTDEGSLRFAIRARAAGGQLREAEATYRSFRERAVNQEGGVGWEPSAETAELLETLRSLPRREGLSGGASPAPLKEPPLVGRGKALRELSTLLHPPFDDGLHVAVLRGEAGMGKTRLVEESLARVAVDGVLPLRGRCSEFQSGVPLSPLLDALGVSVVSDAVRRLHDPWRGVILNLMPELMEPGETPPEVPELEPDGPPRRLSESVLVLLAEVARHRPLVLFLDDVHWIDPTTRAVIDHLKRRRHELPARLIVTARPEELERHPSTRRFVESLTHDPGEYAFEVPALTSEESRELVAEVAGGRLGDGELSRVSDLGQGCPLFLIELTQEALQGRPAMSDGEWGPARTLALPSSIEQLLEARLDDLRTNERVVLELMAVYDRPIGPVDLTSLVDLTEDETIQALRTLEGRRLARSTEDGEVVAHGLMSRGVYRRIGAPQRAVYHRRVAEQLLEQEGDTSLGRVALHFHWAGDRERARDCAMDAAERAQEAGAVKEVAALLEVARANAEDEAQGTHIVRRLGNLHYRHRDFEQAAHFLGLAATRLEAMGHTRQALESELRRIHVRASQDWENRDEYLRVLRQVKEEAAAREHWQVLNEALDIELRLRDSAGDEAGVRDVLSQAEEILGHGPPWVECRTLAILGIHLYYGDPHRAHQVCLRAVGLARDHSLQHELLLALNRLLLVFITQAKLETEEGLAAMREAQHLAMQSGDLLERFNPFLNLAVWYMDTGRLEEAERTFVEAQKVLDATPDRALRQTLHVNLGELRLHQRRYAESRDHFAWLDPADETHTSPRHQVLAFSGTGLAHLLRGEIDQARSYWAGADLHPATWSMDPYLPIAFAARMLAQDGRSHEARELLDTTVRRIANRFVPATLKLMLELVRLLENLDHPRAVEVAQAGENMAEEKGLYQRATEFSALLSRLS